jgi:hypothetical protein
MQKKKGDGEEQKMREGRKKGAGRREKRKCLPWLYDEQNCLDEAFVRNVIMSANAYS